MKKVSSPRLILISSFRILAFFLFFLIAPFCLLSHTAVITVPGDYPTIQGAIDAASDGDEIIVSPGTYYESINFAGKNIILRSTDPTSQTIVANTTISGDHRDPVATFTGTESSSCTLSGFTITGGSGSPGSLREGGGIYGNYTLATIQNNIITGNNVSSEAGQGGGIAYCNGTIQGNIISNNSASGMASGSGGGLYQCHGTIQNNIISNNSASSVAYGLGGGLFRCNGMIQNNTIRSNRAKQGGGLAYCYGIMQNNIISDNLATVYYGGGLADCSGVIQNNIIFRNNAREGGGGIAHCGSMIRNNTIYGNSVNGSPYTYGSGLYRCFGTIVNCIIWQNYAADQLYDCSAPSYSCIQDWTGGGTGNITSDPHLVDPVNGDFHLQSTSACIDAGCSIAGLFQDFEGDPRPWDGIPEARGDGSGFDMGADEYYYIARSAVSPKIWYIYQ